MTTVASPCVHVWDIEPASGPTSQGTCTRCGETKEFRNRPSYEEVDALLVVEGVHRLHPEKHNVVLTLRKREPQEKEEKEMPRGATRIAELAETKERFFQMVREDRSVADIEAMLKDAPGGPPSNTSLRIWWIKARKLAKETAPAKDTPQSEVDACEEMARKVAAGLAADIDTRIMTGESPPDPEERLWQMVMMARPDWKDKPRLGRWMDLVDATYAFLVEAE